MIEDDPIGLQSKQNSRQIGCGRTFGEAAIEPDSRESLVTNSAIRVVGDDGCSVFRTCKRASGGQTDCRNAAQCESLGHRPRNCSILNTNALKGRDGGMPHHFAPLGLFLSQSIFPRAMPWAFTFRAFGPGLSVRLQRTFLGRIRDQGLPHWRRSLQLQRRLCSWREKLKKLSRRSLKSIGWRKNTILSEVYLSVRWMPSARTLHAESRSAVLGGALFCHFNHSRPK